MEIPATFDNLIEEATKIGLYKQLVQQLNKDLLLANIELDFDEDVLPTSLRHLLHETVYNLIQERFADYLNLLYIIDVPEQKIKQLDGSDIVKLSDQVVFLILLREWQKVWYKNQYH